MHAIRTRFTAAAAGYNRAAAIQYQVAARLLALMPTAIAPARVLDAGCGTGLLTAGLRERFPAAVIDAIDLAPGMVARARENLATAGIRWLTGDIRAMDCHGGYDLIASSSAMHWVQPLAAGFAALHRHLAETGILCCAVMTDGTLDELHGLRTALFPGKAPAARLPSPEHLRQALADSQFEIKTFMVEHARTRHDSAGAMLRSLHDQGVTGGPLARARAPLTRGELRTLTATYDASFKDGPGVYATYTIAYVIATRRHPVAPYPSDTAVKNEIFRQD